MSIISGLRDYFLAYSDLKAGSPVLTDFLGSLPTQYAIVPLAGSRTIEIYLNDTRTCEYTFAFQAMEYTVNDAERMENEGFLEDLADWLDTQSDAGTLPSIGASRTAEKIEALGHGYLFQEGQSDTGVYQIQCRLTYKQD